MSGAGGFTMLGNNGTYLSMVPGGTVTLQGTNTYTGPTTVFPGTLIVKKAAGLYNGDHSEMDASEHYRAQGGDAAAQRRRPGRVHRRASRRTCSGTSPLRSIATA